MPNIHSEGPKPSKRSAASAHREEEASLELAPCAYLTLTPPENICRINLSGARLLGTDPAFLESVRLSRFIDPESQKSYLDALKRSAETAETQQAELKLTNAQGQPVWVLADIAAASASGDEINRWRLTFTDISALKRSELDLKQSEGLLRNLIENIAVGVMVVTPQMEIIYLNKQMHAWCPSLGPAQGQLCYQSFNEPPAAGVCRNCPAQTTLRNGRINEAVLEKTVGGEARHFRIVSSPVRNEDDTIGAVIESIEDVTESYHVHTQIRNLTQKLISAQETERRMISRELHDNLAQEITAAKMICDTFSSGCESEPPAHGQPIQKIAEILSKCISDIRQLSYDLRPPGLKQFGVIETLRHYTADFQETFKIAVDFQAGGFEQVHTDDDLSVNLYRLVQEGLNNVMKHAAASRVSIRLVAAHPNILLRIEDDGTGFDVAKRQASITSEKKMGLRSMQERVELMQGTMTIKSKPGCGTRLFIKLPVAERSHGRKKNYTDRR